MISSAKFFSLLIACATLAVSLWYSKYSWISAIFIIVFVFLLIFSKKVPEYLNFLIFIGLVSCAAYGIWIGGSLPIILLSCTTSLAYWDLDAFERRFRNQEYSETTKEIEKSHLYRLIGSLGVGYLIGLVGSTIHINLSLGWAILLGATIFLGIFLIIKIVRTPAETT